MSSSALISQLLLPTESARVKCVKWDRCAYGDSFCRLLVTLYSGDAELWSIQAQQDNLGQNSYSKKLLKSEPDFKFNVSDTSPLRSGDFLSQKGPEHPSTHVALACDDGCVYIRKLPDEDFNLASMTQNQNADTQYEMSDEICSNVSVSPFNCFVRCVVSHPLKFGFFASSDDGTVSMYLYDKLSESWKCEASHTKHLLNAMQIAVAPIGPNKVVKICSVSQDMTAVIWVPETNHFTVLEQGHTGGLNCVQFHPDASKPYLLTGADDYRVAVWNYQTQNVVKRIDCFNDCLTCVSFSPFTSLILAGAEDCYLRSFKSQNYKKNSDFKSENEKITHNQKMGRVWSMNEGPNGLLAVGYDKGFHVYQLSQGGTLFSVDKKRKMLYCHERQVMQLNLASLDQNQSLQSINDSIQPKKLGNIDFETVEGFAMSQNGKFLVAQSDDSNFTVFSTLALRNQCFGKSEVCPVFSHDSEKLYAFHQNTIVTYHSNFKSQSELKVDYSVQSVFGGPILAAVASESSDFEGTYFYTTDVEPEFICSIQLKATKIFWHDDNKFAIISEESRAFLVEFDRERGSDSTQPQSKEFKIVYKFNYAVNSCLFADQYALIPNGSKLECLNITEDASAVEKTTVVSNLNGDLLFTIGKEYIVSAVFKSAEKPKLKLHKINFDSLNFMSLILAEKNDEACDLFVQMNIEEKDLALKFLEKKNKISIVYDKISDKRIKANYALKTENLEDALDLVTSDVQLEEIVMLAIKLKNTDVAMRALEKSSSPNLSLKFIIMLSKNCPAEDFRKLAAESKLKNQANIELLANLYANDARAALSSLATAPNQSTLSAIFARTYLPEEVPNCMNEWKNSLRASGNEQMAELLVESAKPIPSDCD